MPLALFLFVAVAGVVYLAASSSDDAPATDTADAGDAAQPVAPVASTGDGLFAALGRAVTSMWKPPAAAAPFLDAISAAETKYGLPANLLARQLQVESGYAPDVISGDRTSSVGALGIAQFMPATAHELSIDPTDPSQAIPAAAAMMRRLYDKFGSWSTALAAYNWGEGNVARKGLDKAPAETRDYVAKILGPLGLDA